MNISAEEFFSWRLYYYKRGTFNLGLRIDRGAALVATRHSGGKMRDIMPWSKEDQDETNSIQMTEENLVHDKGFKVVDDRKVAIGSKKMLQLEDKQPDPSRIVIIKHDRKVRK